MKTFKKPNREQQLLFATVKLDTIAPIGSPLRAIDELVDELDTKKIEETYNFEIKTGARPMHPKTLIKVALYALHNCRFSLRKIESDTQFHLGYRWITGDEKIDHSTMGKFLSKFSDELSELFSQVVMIGVEHDLIDFEVLNVDTVKIRANASYKQFRDLKGIREEKKKIRKKLDELLNDSEQEALDEQRILAARLEKLEWAKRELEERINLESEDEKKQQELKEKKKINLTDPDCELMQQANREINSAFAITMSSDASNDFITDVKVQDHQNDVEALLPAIEGSREATQSRHKVVNADSGFSSVENLEKLKEDNQDALIPDRRMDAESRGVSSKGEYDRSHFSYDAIKDMYVCPQSEELHHKSSSKQKGRIYHLYCNKDACRSCKYREKCTKGKYRTISRDENEAIKEEMRDKLNDSENKKIYKLRAHAIESPFGQIKHNLKYRIVMRRGRKKVLMELSLLGMLHNILKLGTVLQMAA
jgi:transposase